MTMLGGFLSTLLGPTGPSRMQLPALSHTKCLNDLNAQLREWIWGVANQRVHGTTHEQVMVRWDVEQFSLQSLAGQPPYPYVDGELRKVARDAYVDWQGSRYSVPWQYAGQEVWVREMMEEVEIRTGRERIAMHGKAQRKHSVLTFPPHHQGIPLGARRAEGKRMSAWPTEVGDEHPDRAIADVTGDAGIESGGSQARKLTGTSIEARAELRGLSR